MSYDAFLTPKIYHLLCNKVSAAIYLPQADSSAKIWNYAAALLLVKEFGGYITSLSGNPLPLRGPEVNHFGGWLATRNYDLHKKLLGKFKTYTD